MWLIQLCGRSNMVIDFTGLRCWRCRDWEAPAQIWQQ